MLSTAHRMLTHTRGFFHRAMFFPGHVAMYIGSGRYCHSTAKAGDNGFTINSLIPSHPDYRDDLRHSITQVGTYFKKG